METLTVAKQDKPPCVGTLPSNTPHFCLPFSPSCFDNFSVKSKLLETALVEVTVQWFRPPRQERKGGRSLGQLVT